MRDFIRGLLLVMFAALAWLLHGCSKPELVQNESAAVRSIAISPSNAVIPTGFQEAFRATGTFSDHSTRDVTADVTWKVSPGDVAEISNTAPDEGQVRSVLPGLAIVTATMGDVVGTTSVRATTAQLTSISVSPFSSAIPVGIAQQFAAVGIFDDQSMRDITAEASWESSAPSVASVSSTASTRGMVTTGQAGSVTVSAKLFGVTGSTSVEVTSAAVISLSLTPTDRTLAQGLTEQIEATGIFSDGSTQDLTAQVEWMSSAPAVASISNDASTKGKVAATAVGSADISASFGNLNATTSLAVSAAVLQSLSITPPRPGIAKGLVQQFHVQGIFSDDSNDDLTATATWASSSAGVAAIAADGAGAGLATGMDVGTAEISASLGGMTASTTLTVNAAILTSLSITPASSAAAVGLTQQLHVAGAFSDMTTQDLTTQATWSSSAGAIAGVSNVDGSRGLVTALGAGSTVITASFGGMQASTNLAVSAATVTSVSITPPHPSVAKGLPQQFHLTGVFSDGSTADLTAQATWASSVWTVATISNAASTRGFASALGAGATDVSATFRGMSASTTLTVSAAVPVSLAMTPVNPSVSFGSTQQFHVSGTFSDGSTQDLTAMATWTSSADLVAAISNALGTKGLVTALGLGASTVTATYAGLSASTMLVISL